MPRGYPNKNKVHVIEVPPPTQRNGFLGRLDRMHMQLAFDAAAIRRTLELVDADDRRIAAEALPQKLLHASNITKHRHVENGNGHHVNGNGRTAKTAKKAKRSGKWAMPINGKRLALFLLESLDAEQHRDLPPIREKLAELMPGVTVPGRALNGVSGAMMNHGYIKRTADGYRLTSLGVKHAAELRTMLVEKGKLGANYHAP